MAAVANPEDIDDKFRQAVKKSSNQAHEMEKEETEWTEAPTILQTIKQKAESVLNRVMDAAHHIIGDDTHIESPSKEDAEFYAERASEKYDGDSSSLSSKRKSTD